MESEGSLLLIIVDPLLSQSSNLAASSSETVSAWTNQEMWDFTKKKKKTRNSNCNLKDTAEDDYICGEEELDKIPSKKAQWFFSSLVCKKIHRW